MTRLRVILTFAALCSALPFAFAAQAQTNEDKIETISGDFYYDVRTDVATYTNGVQLKWNNAELSADHAWVNTKTGDTTAEGRVRIQRDNQVFVGERMQYNFKTKQMGAEQ